MVLNMITLAALIGGCQQIMSSIRFIFTIDELSPVDFKHYRIMLHALMALEIVEFEKDIDWILSEREPLYAYNNIDWITL